MAVHDTGEAPLDPAAERLRRKLVRLLFVSAGIMLAGLIAVFAAIVYKLSESSRAGSAGVFSAAAPIESRVAVPAGHRLVSTELDGERAMLTIEGPGGSALLILVDLSSGEIIGRYTVEAEAER